MAIIDLVKWNMVPGLQIYVWKFPSEELSTNTQLIVSETQEAILLKGGKMIGTFGPGRHTLDTENIPILKTLFSIPFGGKSPYTAEVWFINKAIALDVKWGTTDPIQLMDPKYQIMLPIRCFGQFGVQIEEGAKFLIKLVGTLSQYDGNTLMSHFKGIVISKVKDLVAKKIIKEQISILEISASLTEISEFLQKEIQDDLAEFGLKMLHFKVLSINAPENDRSVVKLKEALAKKAEMNIVGYSYQQERSFDTLESAASNQGMGGSGPMGAGIGLGLGFGMGGVMGTAASGMAKDMQFGQQQQQPQAIGIGCPKCAAQMPPGTKFCPGCGFSMQQPPAPAPELYACDKCGTKSPKGAKFCPNCGDVFNICPKCGSDNPDGQVVCVNCATPMPVKCSGCGALVAGDTRFCPDCGNELMNTCSKCGEKSPSAVKFCPHCGTGFTK